MQAYKHELYSFATKHFACAEKCQILRFKIISTCITCLSIPEALELQWWIANL